MYYTQINLSLVSVYYYIIPFFFCRHVGIRCSGSGDYICCGSGYRCVLLRQASPTSQEDHQDPVQSPLSNNVSNYGPVLLNVGIYYLCEYF